MNYSNGEKEEGRGGVYVAGPAKRNNMTLIKTHYAHIQGAVIETENKSKGQKTAGQKTQTRTW